MNITNEIANYLLRLPKKISDKNGKLLSQITIVQDFPFHERFELSSKKDDEYSFLWDMRQSSKNTLKISLHFQEDDSKIGLLRIDYNGVHTNPQKTNEYVPEKFYPYVGQVLTKSHIHYYVQGYQHLDWAIPLTEDEFKIKEFAKNDFNNTIATIIKEFAKTINVETTITLQTSLLSKPL